MAKILTGSKLNKALNKCINDIAKDIDRLMGENGNEGDLKKLVGDIMTYNVYDTDPSLMSYIPPIDLEEKEGLKNTNGQFSVDRSYQSLWINRNTFSPENIRKNPQVLAKLLTTVSHEMRHWYQHNYKNSTQSQDLVLAGQDNDLFQDATKDFSLPRALGSQDLNALYAKVGHDDLVNDVMIMAEQGVVGNEDLETLLKSNDNAMRNWISNQIAWAGYSSSSYELDARLTGTSEMANIVSALRNVKSKNVKSWANETDIHALIENELNNEEVNYNVAEGKAGLPINRVVQLMGNVEDGTTFEEFKASFFNDRTDEEIDKLMNIAVAQGVPMRQRVQLSNEQYLNLFREGKIDGFEGEKVDVTPRAYKEILNSIKDLVGMDEVYDRAKDLFLEGKFEEAYSLNGVKGTGLKSLMKFNDHLNKVAEENIDTLCQYLKDGKADENVLRKCLTTKTKTEFAGQLNDARLEHINSVQNDIETKNLNFYEANETTLKTLTDLNLIVKDIETMGEDLDNDTIAQYFKLTDQYIETLNNLSEAQKNNLYENELERYNKYFNSPSLEDDYRNAVQTDPEIYDYLIEQIGKNQNNINCVIDSRDLIGVFKEKVKDLKEIYILDENENSSENKVQQEVDKVTQDNELQEPSTQTPQSGETEVKDDDTNKGDDDDFSLE